MAMCMKEPDFFGEKSPLDKHDIKLWKMVPKQSF